MHWEPSIVVWHRHHSMWSERDYVISAAQRDGRRSCAASRTGSGNVTDIRLKPLRPRQSPPTDAGNRELLLER